MDTAACRLLMLPCSASDIICSPILTRIPLVRVTRRLTNSKPSLWPAAFQLPDLFQCFFGSEACRLSGPFNPTSTPITISYSALQRNGWFLALIFSKLRKLAGSSTPQLWHCSSPAAWHWQVSWISARRWFPTFFVVSVFCWMFPWVIQLSAWLSPVARRLIKESLFFIQLRNSIFSSSPH